MLVIFLTNEPGTLRVPVAGDKAIAVQANKNGRTPPPVTRPTITRGPISFWLWALF